MNALFLVALIITAARAQTVTEVTTDLLGTWNTDPSGTDNSCKSCTYESVTFTQSGSTTITMNVNAGSCSGSYVLQNVVANETSLTAGDFEQVNLYDQSDYEWMIDMENNQNDLIHQNGLSLTLWPGVIYCGVTFSKGGNLMNAMVGAVVTAVVMLV